MVGHHRVGADAFLQPEILRRIPGIRRIDLRLDTLTVAAGMDFVANVVEMKRRQRSCGIADGVVGGMKGFLAQEVARRVL